jgi:D-3-phosphoglycerate dehydrogenase / 2-oxoglutarate reductase
MRMTDRADSGRSAPLVVALNLEWDDLGREQAALAGIGARLLTLDQLQQNSHPRVVGLLSEGARVTATDLRLYPRLQIVSEFGTGYDGIDVVAAGQLGIAVTNVAGYCTEEVADHTLALALTLLRRLDSLAQQAREGEWLRVDTDGVRRCADLNWGIIGFGRIGRAVARRAMSFGFSVHACDPQLAEHEVRRHGARPVRLEELLMQADVVSIHAARTGRDDHMLDRRRLSLMKPTACLINVARGAFIDEEALADALDAGALAGAALDVMTQEPPNASNRLLLHPRTLVTPHIAWYSDRAESELRERGIRAVVDVLSGREPADLVPELRAPQTDSGR